MQQNSVYVSSWKWINFGAFKFGDLINIYVIFMS